MEGDPVRDAPSQDTDIPITFTEVFMRLCPQYMAMGMSYDEFWNRNTSCHYAYRKAWKIKRDNLNWQAWWQGYYTYTALIDVAPVMRAALSKQRVEPGKYPEAPYPLTEKEAREREEERERINYERYLERMNAASDRELARRRAEEERIAAEELLTEDPLQEAVDDE